MMTSSASQHSLRPPTVEEESQSDSGSLASELDASGKKTKKKRSFFNFRRKKEKIPWQQTNKIQPYKKSFQHCLLKRCRFLATIDETDATVLPIS